jgi:hypothetical protein
MNRNDIDVLRVVNTKDILILLNNKLSDLIEILRMNETKILLSQSSTFLDEQFVTKMNLDYLFNDFEMVNVIVHSMQKVFTTKLKKKERFQFTVKLNSIEYQFRESNALSGGAYNISITINFKDYKNGDLLANICQISFYSKLYMSIVELIKLSQYYKKPMISVTLTNDGLDNAEFKFYLNKLLLGINNHCEFNSYSINLTDYGRCVSNRYTLVVNNTIKQKEKKDYFVYFAKRLQNSSLQAFYKYIDKIVEFVSEFIIDDSINNKTEFTVKTLIRSFRNNKIYVTNNQNGSLSFNVYISNQLFFGDILELIRALDNDNNFLLIKDFTFIFTKSFFEDFLLRRENTGFLNQVLNYSIYIISDEGCYTGSVEKVKKYEEDVKYDIYILDKKIIISNYTTFTSPNGEFGPIIYDFWKIFLYCSDILDRVFGLNKKFISHYIYLINVDGCTLALDITSNGIILKKVCKEYSSLLNNSDIISSTNSIPLISLISNIGGVFNIPIVYSWLRQYAQVFQRQFIDFNEEDENDIRDEGMRFKKYTNDLTRGLYSKLFAFLDLRIFNNLYKNLFVCTNNYNLLTSYASFYKQYHDITGSEMSEIVLFLNNGDEKEILYNLKQLYNDYRFLNNLTVFNTFGQLSHDSHMDIKPEVVKALPFKNTEVISTVEKLENRYTLVTEIDNLKNLPNELTTVMGLVKNPKHILGRLNNQAIIANLYEMFISRLQIYYYQGSSKCLDIITRELVYQKEAKFREENLEDELRPNIASPYRMSNNLDMEIESENSAHMPALKEKKCLIY